MLKAILKIITVHVVTIVFDLAIWLIVAGITVGVMSWWPHSAKLRNITERLIGLPAETTVGIKAKLSLVDYLLFIIRNISALLMFLAGCLMLLREGFMGQSVLRWLLSL